MRSLDLFTVPGLRGEKVGVRRLVLWLSASCLGALAHVLCVVLRSRKGTPTLWAIRGTWLSARGKHAAALELLDRALGVEPENGFFQFGRGLALAALDRHAEAVRCYEMCFTLPGHEGEVRCARARSYVAMYMYEEAIADARAVLQLDVANGEAHCVRGEALFRLGRAQEALEAFEEALRFMPGSGRARLWKVHLLRQVGRLDEALVEIKLVMRFWQTADTYYECGVCFYELGQTDRARMAANKALTIDPAHEGAAVLARNVADAIGGYSSWRRTDMGDSENGNRGGRL